MGDPCRTDILGRVARIHGLVLFAGVNLPGNLLAADQALVYLSGMSPVEYTRRVILILNLVRVPTKPKVDIQLRLQ